MELTLSLTEIIVLMLGAIVLGITIHFFITSRKNLKASLSGDQTKGSKDINEWKLKYFNEIEVKDKELATIRQQLATSEENREIYSIEAEEMRKLNKKLQAEIEQVRKTAGTAPAAMEKQDYFERLREAQANLLEHNEKISQLLGNIDILKETEEKQKEILRDNEQLAEQIEELRSVLALKDQEIGSISQKANLSREMTSMLDNAYSEFNLLQEKIYKLEAQVTASRKQNIEYEDMKEEHLKMKKEYDEQRIKLNAFSSENRDLQEKLSETEDKLRESNFQRQQLQKKVAYLEELNNDLQAVTEANKRLENQIKRIGELESMLNVVSQERDHLMRRQP